MAATVLARLEEKKQEVVNFFSTNRDDLDYNTLIRRHRIIKHNRFFTDDFNVLYKRLVYMSIPFSSDLFGYIRNFEDFIPPEMSAELLRKYMITFYTKDFLIHQNNDLYMTGIYNEFPLELDNENPLVDALNSSNAFSRTHADSFRIKERYDAGEQIVLLQRVFLDFHAFAIEVVIRKGFPVKISFLSSYYLDPRIYHNPLVNIVKIYMEAILGEPTDISNIHIKPTSVKEIQVVDSLCFLWTEAYIFLYLKAVITGVGSDAHQFPFRYFASFPTVYDRLKELGRICTGLSTPLRKGKEEIVHTPVSYGRVVDAVAVDAEHRKKIYSVPELVDGIEHYKKKENYRKALRLLKELRKLDYFEYHIDTAWIDNMQKALLRKKEMLQNRRYITRSVTKKEKVSKRSKYLRKQREKMMR